MVEYEKLLIEGFKETSMFSLENRNGNRSSLRTDILNRHACKLIEEHLPGPREDWTLSTELKIPCTRSTPQDPNKTFSVDVVYTHVETGRRVYVLLKCIERSYNKNRANFANTTLGEVERIYGYSELYEDKLKKDRKNDVTLFLTLMMEHVPVNDSGKYEKTKKSEPNIANLRVYNQNVHQITAILNSNGIGNREENIQSISKIVNDESVKRNFEGFGDNVSRILSI